LLPEWRKFGSRARWPEGATGLFYSAVFSHELRGCEPTADNRQSCAPYTQFSLLIYLIERFSELYEAVPCHDYHYHFISFGCLIFIPSDSIHKLKMISKYNGKTRLTTLLITTNCRKYFGFLKIDFTYCVLLFCRCGRRWKYMSTPTHINMLLTGYTITQTNIGHFTIRFYHKYWYTKQANDSETKFTGSSFVFISQIQIYMYMSAWCMYRNYV